MIFEILTKSQFWKICQRASWGNIVSSLIFINIAVNGAISSGFLPFTFWMWHTMWCKLCYEWLRKLIRWCDYCDISLSPIYYIAYILPFQDNSCFGKICTLHALIWNIFFTVTFQSHVRNWFACNFQLCWRMCGWQVTYAGYNGYLH